MDLGIYRSMARVALGDGVLTASQPRRLYLSGQNANHQLFSSLNSWFCGRCLYDFVLHNCSKSKLQSTQTDLHWRAPNHRDIYCSGGGFTCFLRVFVGAKPQHSVRSESRGGRPGLPVPNSPYGLCGRLATGNLYSSLLPLLEWAGHCGRSLLHLSPQAARCDCTAVMKKLSVCLVR